MLVMAVAEGTTTAEALGAVPPGASAVERAKSDPAGFAARLHPQTLQRLRELSVTIPDAKR